MASTQLEIINRALVRIGEARLKSPTQEGKAARLADEMYDPARRHLLALANWTFAMKRATLAAASAQPVFGFESKYPLPADCLRFVGVSTGAEQLRNYTGSCAVWKVEGRNVLVDQTGALHVFYVADITDPTQFDPIFEETLAWYLASSDFAYAMSAAQNRITVAEAKYQETLKKASFTNAIQSTPELFVASEWMDSRNIRGGAGPRRGPVA